MKKIDDALLDGQLCTRLRTLREAVIVASTPSIDRISSMLRSGSPAGK
jgi:hypothetical protein